MENQDPLRMSKFKKKKLKNNLHFVWSGCARCYFLDAVIMLNRIPSKMITSRAKLYNWQKLLTIIIFDGQGTSAKTLVPILLIFLY